MLRLDEVAKDLSMAVESEKCSGTKKETRARISDKVLFVRNLPYHISNEEFEKVFSEIGPLKRAFVAREKGKFTKCFLFTWSIRSIHITVLKWQFAVLIPFIKEIIMICTYHRKLKIGCK